MKLHRRRFNNDDLLDLAVNLEGISNKISNLRESYPSWTWFDTDRNMLACVGMIPIWSGLVEVWAIFSQITRYHPLRYELVKDLRQIHVDYSKLYKVRRAQALVTESLRDGHALVLRLGYKLESKMPLYGPNGETFYRYVWYAKDYV